ncbi:MAG TPA: hypothetical protein VGO93_17555, partial [Candidatus Xenobia bacterium]
MCPADSLVLRARLQAWQGGASNMRGEDIPGGCQRLQEAHALALQSGDPNAIFTTCTTYGFGGHLCMGRFEAGISILDQGVAVMRLAGEASRQVHLLMNRAILQCLAGRLGEAQASLDAAARLPSESHWLDCGVLVVRAYVAVERQDLEGASTALAALHEASVPSQMRPWYLRVRVLFHAFKQEFRLAERIGGEMIEALAVVGPRGMYAPECYLSLACLHALEGSPVASLHWATEALSVAMGGCMPYWEMKARVCLAVVLMTDPGRRSEARGHLEQSLRLTRENRYEAFWQVDSMGWSRPLLEQVASDPWARTLRSGLAPGPSSLPAMPAVPHDVEIHTLGRFSVVVAGGDVTGDVCARRKVSDLLKLVLSSPGLTLPIEVAMERLWPETDPDRARHNLRTHVSLLRKRVPLVASKGQAYRLAPTIYVDRVELEGLLESAQRLLSQADVEGARTLLDRAAILYQGDFLPNDLYDDGLAATRSRLRCSYRETVRRMADRVGPEE